MDSVLPVLDWLKNTDFFIAPASTRFHGAYEGGLFDHCMNVADRLCLWTRLGVTRWKRPESPVIVGLLHDVTKLGAYIHDPYGNSWVHNPEWTCLRPHGEDSVVKLANHIELTEEEQFCIRWHMGAYETDRWDDYDKAIRAYANVLWTHTADMYASKIMEV